MQAPAQQFIDLLESQHLLSADILDELRKQLAESKTKLTPEVIAKLLVDNGHLTKFQATRLIAEVNEPVEAAAVEAVEATSEEELGLADQEELTALDAEEPVEATAAGNVAEVILDDDDEEDDVVEVEAMEEAVPVAEVEPIAEDLGGQESDSDFGNAPAPAKAAVKKANVAKGSPWDSFRILGVGLLLAFTVLIGGFLVYFFFTEGADKLLERADSLYQQRSYEDAAKAYLKFSENYSTRDEASYAKVRNALAQLRKDAENAPDPAIGLETAVRVLPPVIGESGLSTEQSDLAGALVGLAEKFIKRADGKKETAERKELMDDMGQLMKMIEDPQYVGSTQRAQQAPVLERILEDRQRILREINRDEELVKAIGLIDARLAEKDTPGAYQVRDDLINRYPLLEADEQVVERVKQASDILRDMVASATNAPKLSQESRATEKGKSFLLANNSGEAIPALEGQSIFIKAKGSVYSIDAGSGKIAWRKFVGRGLASDPVRLGTGKQADVLVTQAEEGMLMRMAGATGETKWMVDFAEPILPPIFESEDIFIATYSGKVASLDATSGQLRWNKQLPQTLGVAPGVAFGKRHIYIPADHSNVYVLDRRDGASKEVLYTGHRVGSVVVPPVLLLGQLFIFENIDTESSRIRILGVNDEGLGLKKAQPSINMAGNIVVPPTIDRRYLYVQSDLGAINVLDIEPTVETNKVNVQASIPQNRYEPQSSWGIFKDNKLWTADSRFTQFDLVVSQGKLSRSWIRNDGDQFTGPMQFFEKYIVHTRTPRGNQGVRITAVRSADGEVVWQTDVGVPVALLNKGEGGYDAVNSNGNYFKLDNQPVRNTADLAASNSKFASRFGKPAWLENGSAVLLNEARTNQLATYSASGKKLQIMTASYGMAKPSCPFAAVGDKIAVGLENGQLVLVDPTNGTLASSPYQPPVGPGKKVTWNRPVYNSNDQSLIVASTRQKLVRLSTGASLRPLTEVDLENVLLGPLTLLGNRVIAIEKGKASDNVLSFDATSLSKENVTALEGRVISGPFMVADNCIVQTENSLVMVAADGKIVWTVPFAKSSVVGMPVADGQAVVVATRDGMLHMIGLEDGSSLGSLDAGQPLSSSPVALGNVVLVGSGEGAVLALPKADFTSNAQAEVSE